MTPGSLGHLEQITWPDSRQIQFNSDAQGWVTDITYPDKTTEYFRYDAVGNLTNHVDRAGRVTRMSWLPTRKLESVSRTVNGQTVGLTHEYDQQMNSLVIKDALNRQVESYILDANDRPVSVANLEGQTMSINYGLDNFIKSVTRFDYSYITNTYDDSGRLVQIQYPGAAISCEYLANGLLKKISDSAGSVSNAYDMANRLTKTVGATPNSTVEYGYHPGGQVSAVTSLIGEVSYALDAGDRLSSIAAPAGTFGYSYNANNGLIAKVARASGVFTVTNKFDAMDQVTEIKWAAGTNQPITFNYGHNNAGMITQKVTVINGLGATNNYTYDNLDRLTSEIRHVDTNTFTVAYAYDRAGNRTQMTENGTNINYYLGQGNRLNTFGATGDYDYDAAGNVTDIEYNDGRDLGLTWDSRYRLTAVSTNGTPSETYTYDALGRRVSITSAGITEKMVYDGMHVIADTDQYGNLRRSYTYGPGIDNILAMTVHTGGTAVKYYYVKDHLGSVQAIVDSSGDIVESYEYDAFGNVLGVFDSTGGVMQGSSVGNRYLWQGREYSWNTRLYYFRARWYDPKTGRWLSNDPIGISGGLNQYVFCANNPVNFVDPTGEAAIEAHDYWTSVAVSGQDAGGVLGNLQTAGASVMISFIDFWGTRTLEKNAGLSGQYSASDECQGKAWKHGLLAGGQIALSAASAFGGNNAVHPFYRFVGPGSRPGIGTGTWLARGTRGSIPYGSIENAISKLQIPPQSQVNAVQQVRNVWWRYIAGPRPASGNPAWGAGGGLEYRIGGF